MKKTFVSASVASVLAVASFGALADGPSFYGRLDLSVTNTETGATLQNGTNGLTAGEYANGNNGGTYLENNFSNLGVKGSEKVADGVEILYQMEFQVENTSNSDTVFKARNTFLGAKTAAGTVLVGRNDPVFKTSEGGVDLFGNTNADIDRLVSGQSREADTVSYYSPKFAGLFTVNASYIIDDNEAAAESKDSHGDYAASITLGDAKFKEQNYYVATAYEEGLDGINAYRFVGQVKLGDFKLGGLYQNSELTTNSDVDGNTYFVNVAYDLNGVNLKAQYGFDDSGFGSYYKNMRTADGKSVRADANEDFNLHNFTIGADYRVAKSTLVYGQYALYQGDYEIAGVKTDLKDDNVISVGVRYDF